MSLAFYIYRSPKNDKFYWRLTETINVGYNEGNEIYNTIATGHQGYDTIEEAKKILIKLLVQFLQLKLCFKVIKTMIFN